MSEHTTDYNDKPLDMESAVQEDVREPEWVNTFLQQFGPADSWQDLGIVELQSNTLLREELDAHIHKIVGTRSQHFVINSEAANVESVVDDLSKQLSLPLSPRAPQELRVQSVFARLKVMADSQRFVCLVIDMETVKAEALDRICELTVMPAVKIIILNEQDDLAEALAHHHVQRFDPEQPQLQPRAAADEATDFKFQLVTNEDAPAATSVTDVNSAEAPKLKRVRVDSGAKSAARKKAERKNRRGTILFTSVIISGLLLAGAAIVYLQFIDPGATRLQALVQSQESEAPAIEEKSIIRDDQAIEPAFATGAPPEPLPIVAEPLVETVPDQPTVSAVGVSKASVRYAIQLVAFGNTEFRDRFLARTNDPDLRSIPADDQEQVLHYVIYGAYETFSEAKNALENLPDIFDDTNPVVLELSDQQRANLADIGVGLDKSPE
ncbi:MAG: SPOR domain-containing protein [Pseudomonadota bacterium]